MLEGGEEGGRGVDASVEMFLKWGRKNVGTLQQILKWIEEERKSVQ